MLRSGDATVGLAVSRQLPWHQVPDYIAAQVIGAIVGAAAIMGVLGNKASDLGLGVASYAHISWTQAFTAEFIGTFILVFTELLAGVAAALVYGVLSHTPADGATAGPGIDLADPKAAADPEPTYAPPVTA